jgi:uncharacterized protein YprB with RNaseH-like and TPR domain
MEDTFIHFSGIGPKREGQILSQGIKDWEELKWSLLESSLPFGDDLKDGLLKEIQVDQKALKENNIGHLIERFPPTHQWKILSRYLNKATFFDIETTGLSPYQSSISVIGVYHRGKREVFIKGKNLDDFLDLLEEVDLLVSFNGNSFDAPWILHQFHIPELPCAHLDLRWPCYHLGLVGGLKKIEGTLGLSRANDIRGISGLEAILLWENWEAQKDLASLKKLCHYCLADTVALSQISRKVCELYLAKQKDLNESFREKNQH